MPQDLVDVIRASVNASKKLRKPLGSLGHLFHPHRHKVPMPVPPQEQVQAEMSALPPIEDAPPDDTPMEGDFAADSSWTQIPSPSQEMIPVPEEAPLEASAVSGDAGPIMGEANVPGLPPFQDAAPAGAPPPPPHLASSGVPPHTTTMSSKAPVPGLLEQLLQRQLQPQGPGAIPPPSNFEAPSGGPFAGRAASHRPGWMANLK